jgi:hypothetical protein
MSPILKVDGDVYDRATMRAHQLEALCSFTSIAQKDFNNLADSSRDDLLSLISDLTRGLCETLTEMRRAYASEQAEAIDA